MANGGMGRTVGDAMLQALQVPEQGQPGVERSHALQFLHRHRRHELLKGYRRGYDGESRRRE